MTDKPNFIERLSAIFKKEKPETTRVTPSSNEDNGIGLLFGSSATNPGLLPGEAFDENDRPPADPALVEKWTKFVKDNAKKNKPEDPAP